MIFTIVIVEAMELLQVNTLEGDGPKRFIIAQGSKHCKKLEDGVYKSIGGWHKPEFWGIFCFQIDRILNVANITLLHY